MQKRNQLAETGEEPLHTAGIAGNGKGFKVGYGYTGYIVIAAIIVMLGAVMYLLIEINRSVQEQDVLEYKTLQFLLAKEVSHEVAQCLKDGSDYLKTLSGLESVQRGGSREILKDFELYHSLPSRKVFEHAVISVVNTQGVAAFATAGETQGWDFSSYEFFNRAATNKNDGNVFVSSWDQGAAVPKGILPDSFLLAKPIYQTNWDSAAQRPVETWSGVLLLTMDIQTLLKEFLAASGPTGSRGNIWIMDHDGTVLMQTERPEMVRNCISMFHPGSQCAQCHLSFGYARRMLGGGSGTTDYQLRLRPKKMAAFVPMHFANVSWIMVVNSSYDNATAFISHQYKTMLLLIGTVVVVLGFAFVGVYRVNASRTHAHEEALRLRLKREFEEKVRRAETETHQRFEQLFRKSPALMALLTLPEQRCFDINEAFLNVLGFPKDEVIGKTAVELGLFPDSGQQTGAVDKLLAKGHITDFESDFEFKIRCKDDALVDGIFSGEVISSHGQQYFLVVMVDITERKRAEAKMLQMLATERELNTLKSTFVTMVSHEFRTPLAAILGASEMLEDFYDGLEPERRTSYFQLIRMETQRMTGMMQNALLQGQLEAGRVEFQPRSADVVTLCRQVAARTQATFPKHPPVHFVADAPPLRTLADETLLERVFSNLLANAFKYSPALTPVRFSVRRVEEEWEIQVQDHGIGISARDQETLFSAFRRGSNVGNIKGTGMGLYIVKKCAELHGGRVELRSQTGQGSTFVFAFPWRPAESVSSKDSFFRDTSFALCQSGVRV